MALTAAQLTTLKADIAASEFSGLPLNDDSSFAIASAYNLPASPDFWVWRTSVSKAEYHHATSVDGTVFNFTGAGYITRSAGERECWETLFNGDGFANPSLANVRQAVADIFSGATAPAPANRTHLLTVSRRKATRFEKLFATGTGSTGSPATMVLEGAVTYGDVSTARNLP